MDELDLQPSVMSLDCLRMLERWAADADVRIEYEAKSVGRSQALSSSAKVVVAGPFMCKAGESIEGRLGKCRHQIASIKEFWDSAISKSVS